MKIRSANKFDKEQVIELKKFQQSGPAELLQFTGTCDITKTAGMYFDQIIYGKGVLIVAEDEGTIVGLAMGLIIPFMWDNDVLILNELAFYVEEDHRNGTVGYRLLKDYLYRGQSLVNQKRIKAYTMCKMTNSPDIKYQKFGLEKLEETWVGVN